MSRTVRAREKILGEINPLRHQHTPPHLFPAKNVILSKFCHGSKNQKMLVFAPTHLHLFLQFQRIFNNLFSGQSRLSQILSEQPMTPCLPSLTTTFQNQVIMLYRFGGDSITVLVICRYPRTEARELENIEIDI